MNGQEIIEMARQVCDVTADSRGRESFDFDSYGLKAFAKLVAAKERDDLCKYFQALEDKATSVRDKMYLSGVQFVIKQRNKV